MVRKWHYAKMDSCMCGYVLCMCTLLDQFHFCLLCFLGPFSIIYTYKGYSQLYYNTLSASYTYLLCRGEKPINIMQTHQRMEEIQLLRYSSSPSLQLIPWGSTRSSHQTKSNLRMRPGAGAIKGQRLITSIIIICRACVQILSMTSHKIIINRYKYLLVLKKEQWREKGEGESSFK